MACYKPIQAWQVGKNQVRFSPFKGADPLLIGCGKCIGCRLERSRQWAVRCVHEAQGHVQNCFITLTFNPEAIKNRGHKSLDKKDFQNFMKRLRKAYEPRSIRFFHCGEYGESLGRPHYHACLFGFDFQDKYLWRGKLFRSATLERLWPHGFSTIGEVNFETAAYVARYILKKRFGASADDHYSKTDQKTGEIIQLEPEYTTMSRHPGIGRYWLEKYQTDVYPLDRVVVRGREMRPPRYYDKVLEKQEPSLHQDIIKKRKEHLELKLLDESGPSLETQEKFATETLRQKPRRYEK